MKFTHYPLGHLSGGSIVTVALEGTEANVRLVDDINLTRYRRQDQHSYYGGHYTQSPAVIAVPHSGNWHIVVDLGGFGGEVRSSVTVEAA